MTRFLSLDVTVCYVWHVNSLQNIFCQFLSKTFHKPKLPEVQKSFFIGQILFVWSSLSCASEIPKYFTKMFSINNFGNWDSTKKLPTLGRGLSKIWKNCQRRLKTVIFKFQILTSPNRQMKCWGHSNKNSKVYLSLLKLR